MKQRFMYSCGSVEAHITALLIWFRDKFGMDVRGRFPRPYCCFWPSVFAILHPFPLQRWALVLHSRRVVKCIPQFLIPRAIKKAVAGKIRVKRLSWLLVPRRLSCYLYYRPSARIMPSQWLPAKFFVTGPTKQRFPSRKELASYFPAYVNWSRQVKVFDLRSNLLCLKRRLHLLVIINL